MELGDQKAQEVSDASSRKTLAFVLLALGILSALAVVADARDGELAARSWILVALGATFGFYAVSARLKRRG